MMILFTHGKKILGVKGSKPNFTSREAKKKKRKRGRE